MSSQTNGHGDDTLPSHPRVAVDVLQRDQRAVLFDGDGDRDPPLSPLTDGFADRRAVCNWWQATAVRTFGHLASVFPAREIVRDRALERALIRPDEGSDAHRRQRVLETVVRECDTAYRHLETRANEWLADSDSSETDWTQIDAANQRHVAMRPAFSRLDTEQARCLRELWGGFAGREAIVRWTHSLPAVADFADVLERDVTSAVVNDRHALSMLQGDGEQASAFRERFAATVLLPAMGKRAARLRAGERAEAKRQERTVPHG